MKKNKPFSDGRLKKRYKMYKAGKNMLVAPLVFLGVMGFATNAVKADSSTVSAANTDTNNAAVNSDSSVTTLAASNEYTLKNGSTAASQTTTSAAASSEATNVTSASEKSAVSTASAGSSVAPTSTASAKSEQPSAAKSEVNSDSNSVMVTARKSAASNGTTTTAGLRNNPVLFLVPSSCKLANPALVTNPRPLHQLRSQNRLSHLMFRTWHQMNFCRITTAVLQR